MTLFQITEIYRIIEYQNLPIWPSMGYTLWRNCKPLSESDIWWIYWNGNFSFRLVESNSNINLILY